MLNDKPEVQLDEALDIDDLDSASGGAGSGGGSSGRDGTVVALLPDAEVRVDRGNDGGDSFRFLFSFRPKRGILRLDDVVGL